VPRVCVIVNPAAGAGRTARRWPEIVNWLKDLGLDFSVSVTEGPGHAVELAKSAASTGPEMVVSIGGDGTMNEVVNGIHDAGGLWQVALGVIGTGTGGDYLRSVGLPNRCDEACRRLLNSGKRKVDLGVLEYTEDGRHRSRLFVNFAGVGFAGEVVRRTTRQFKSLGRTPSYLLAVISTFASHRNSMVRLTVDGEVSERKIATLILSHGKYGGGGMQVAPNADPSDGFYDVLVIGDISRPDLIASFPRVYRGTHLTHPKLTLRQAREVEFQSHSPMAVQVDGDLVPGEAVRFSVLPKALTLAV
jgi:YegS/Rv2252/BmrU family lipid kinase